MSTLSKNIVYNISGQVSLLILGFAAVKYVFNQLGPDALGIIYFALAMNLVLSSLVDMGISSTLVREVAAHFHDDTEYVRGLVRTASLFYWSAYLLLAVGIFFGAPWLVTRWINLKSLDSATATHALQILAVGALVGLPRSLYTGILRGLERMEFNNIIDVSTSALQQFGTIAILILRGGLLRVACWLSICFALSILAYAVISARFFSFRALVPGFSASVVKRIYGYASRMASISLLAMVHTQADKAIVSKLLPIGFFGYYGLAYSAVSRGTLVTNAVSQAAFPALSADFKLGDQSSLMARYRKLQDLLCFGTVPLFAVIPFAAIPLFTYLLNAEAARMLLLPITFLSVGFYMNGTLTVPYVFSLAVGKPGIAARLNFYALFCVLPVTFALVYFFGLTGAGFSWVFYHLFAYAYAVPRICLDCLKTPKWKWYLHVAKAVALTALTYGLAWAVLRSTGDHSLLPLALAFGAATTVFMVVAYFCIAHEVRESLNRLFLPRQHRSQFLPL